MAFILQYALTVYAIHSLFTYSVVSLPFLRFSSFSIFQSLFLVSPYFPRLLTPYIIFFRLFSFSFGFPFFPFSFVVLYFLFQSFFLLSPHFSQTIDSFRPSSFFFFSNAYASPSPSLSSSCLPYPVSFLPLLQSFFLIFPLKSHSFIFRVPIFSSAYTSFPFLFLLFLLYFPLFFIITIALSYFSSSIFS